MIELFRVVEQDGEWLGIRVHPSRGGELHTRPTPAAAVKTWLLPMLFWWPTLANGFWDDEPTPVFEIVDGSGEPQPLVSLVSVAPS